MSRTIILAEADRDDTDLVLLAIERAEIETDVILFSDGQSVVDYFLRIDRKSRWHQHCDLVLLDYDLPDLDGLKVLRQLRWLQREDPSKLPPIVLLSSDDHEQRVADAYRHGADGFVCTMASVSRLVAAIEQTLRYWFQTNCQRYAGEERLAMY